MNMESLDDLMAYLKSQTFLKGVKLAVIAENPEIIVFPVLGEKYERKLKIKAFSNVEAATDWIIFTP